MTEVVARPKDFDKNLNTTFAELREQSTSPREETDTSEDADK